MAIPRISLLLMLLASAGSLGCGEKLYVLDTGETGTHEGSDTDGSTGDPQLENETGSEDGGDATGDDGGTPEGETSGDGGTPEGDTGTTEGEGEPDSGGSDTQGDPGGESSGDPGGDTSGDPNPGEELVEQLELESSAAKNP